MTWPVWHKRCEACAPSGRFTGSASTVPDSAASTTASLDPAAVETDGGGASSKPSQACPKGSSSSSRLSGTMSKCRGSTPSCADDVANAGTSRAAVLPPAAKFTTVWSAEVESKEGITWNAPFAVNCVLEMAPSSGKHLLGGLAVLRPTMLHRSPMVPRHGLRSAAGGQVLDNRAEMPHLRHQPRCSFRHSSCVLPRSLRVVAVARARTTDAETGGRSGADVAVSHFHSTAIRMSHMYEDTARVHWLCTWSHGAERAAKSHPAFAHLSAIALPAL